MTNLVSFIPLIMFSIFAFWKSNSVMFMLAAGTAIAMGFSWFDVDVTDRGLSISLMLWAYSTVCVIFAFMCLFSRARQD